MSEGTMVNSINIKPDTDLQSNTLAILKELNENRNPIVITQNGKPVAVIQDPHSFEEMRNTIALLKLVAQGEQDVRDGNTIPHKEVFSGIRERLEGR